MKRSRDDDLPNEHNGPEEQQDKVRKTEETTEQPRREGEEQPPQFEVSIPPQIHPNVPRPLPQEKLPVASVQMRHPQVGAPMVSFAHLTTSGIPPPFQPGSLLGQTGPGQPMPLTLPRQPTPKPSPQVGPTVNSNAMEGMPTLPPAVQLASPKLSHIPPTPPIVPPGVTPQIPGPLPGAAPQPATAYRQVKFENALDFLDQVKLKFQNRPEVYNRFLDIMKDFKAQCIDTPGVIARVSELFKGHKSLILGFNTFLPPGYKIEYVPDDDIVKEQPSTIPVPTPSAPILSQPGSPPPPVVETKPIVTNTVSSNSNSQVNAATQRKQPEFDHARNYVKKIKMRFALQPNIYKAFLEILHTYHKEQHTIKDVYEQVANLFRNHQDLLDEFTQFLPDPVASQPPIIGGSQQQKKKQTRKPKVEKSVLPVAAPVTRKKEKPQEEALPKLTTGEQFNGTYEELNFFYRLKQRINNPNLYYEFLKCLNLFSQGIVSRLELVLLAKDLLARHRDLFEWFQQFIGFDDPAVSDFLEKHDDKPSPTKLPEIDFKTCKRYGPSYRALPKNYISPVCSGRTELCNSVLNDTWVSVPTGSEDYGFKNLRKNQYEEMLFKCEDDRFELDLVIELNASTVRALEPVLKNIQEMSEEEALKFRLDTALDAVLHIRSIERIYGEKGPEVIDALYNNPAGTIPVVLNRLRQKDQEWTKARREWNKIWREVNEKNYYKSLDHQSFYFKQNDKKNLSPKILVAEIKQRYHEKLRELDKEKKKAEGKEDKMEEDREEKVSRDRTGRGPKEEEDEEIDATIKFEYKVDKEDIGKPYHLKYKMDDQVVFTHIVELVRSSPDKNLSRHDREKIDTFFKHFVKEFFFLDELTFPEIKKGENETNGEGSAEEKTPKLNTVEKMDTESTTSPKPEGTKGKTVFYGNTSFYVFLRLLQVLYDRLHKARELSLNSHTNSNFAFLMNPTKSTKEDDGDRYKSFKRILGSFISGGKDQTQYEDDCRALFGIQAYILFTLDRVVQQLTKQLQALLAEEKDSKLLAMFTLNSHQSSDEQMYHSDVARLLEDERCFRFDYEKVPNRGIFTIQLLDSYQNPPMYVDVSSEEKMERWSHYVENYIGSEESTLDNKKHNVFLQRNVVKKGKGAVDMHNGLECRICISSFRLFYVENTEDYMYRRGKLSKSRKFAEKNVTHKQKHLSEILNKKFGPISATEPVFV